LPQAVRRGLGYSQEDATNTLTVNVEGLIRAYLAGTRTLEDLRVWLLDHVQDVLDADDPRLSQLDGMLWLLISEYDRRDRDEASIQATLGQLVTPVPPLPPTRV
jgi:hypothetical protein